MLVYKILSFQTILYREHKMAARTETAATQSRVPLIPPEETFPPASVRQEEVQLPADVNPQPRFSSSPLTDRIIEEVTEENLTPSALASATRSKPEEERVLSITVDIPQGTQEVLEIRETDDIDRVTEKFCQKHELDEDCKQLLLANIRHHLFNEPLEKSADILGLETTENRSSEKGSATQTKKELAGELEAWKRKARQLARERIASLNCPAIDKNSKRIAERRGLAHTPVYERLQPKVTLRVILT